MATPTVALDKVVEARYRVAEAIRLLRDARAIVAERTNESIASGAGDLDAALYALVGDDPEVENVLGPLDALLAANGRVLTDEIVPAPDFEFVEVHAVAAYTNRSLERLLESPGPAAVADFAALVLAARAGIPAAEAKLAEVLDARA